LRRERGKTERRGEGSWGFIGEGWRGEGVRVWRRTARSMALGAAVLEEESKPEEGDDRWGRGVSEKRGRDAYRFG
jgi:hypothetical protein